MWNALPCHIKTSESISKFKAIINCWDGKHLLAESANVQLQNNRLSQK